jgi:hypothetical protein
MRRQPEESESHPAGPLDRRLEEGSPEALAAPLAEHGEALHLGAMRAVLGVGPNHLHGPDDASVLAVNEEHAVLRIELRGRVRPDPSCMLGRERRREPEGHVRVVCVEQQLRQLAGGRNYLVGGELDDLHAVSIPASASTSSSSTLALRT